LHLQTRSLLWPLILAAASVTCSSDSLTLPSEGLPAALTIVSGNNQNGTVALPVADSLVVRVTDTESRPVEGVKVAFTPVLGGGDAVPDTGVTDADGRTRTRWVLGTTAGAQRVQAKVIGSTAAGALTANFDATALAAAADTIFIASGNGQSGAVGSTLADSLVVRVNDRFGNPVPGSIVAWAATGGGSVSPTSSATGATGLAATQRTLGTTAGPQGATATLAGVKGSPVAFSMTAGASAPAALLKSSGDNQSATAGLPLPDSVVVRLVDGSGNGVSGRTVTFTVATGGGSTSPTSVNTNASGYAASRWTLGSAAGSNTLVASAAGFSVTFQATGNPAGATNLLANSTQNQGGTVGAAVATPPSVKVTDINGNAVSGVAVSFAVTAGGGAIVPIVAVVTNGSGIATLTSWTLGTAVGLNTVTASVGGLTPPSLAFNATSVAGAVARVVVETEPSASAQSGVVFAQQPAARLADTYGNPISTSGTAIVASLTSGSGTLNGTKTVNTVGGVATYSNLSITGPAGPYRVRFASGALIPDTSEVVTIGSGVAAKLAVVIQPSASAPSGATFPQQPQVQVQDAAGNPVAGVRSITAAIASGGGSLGGTATISTDASGLASYANLAITGLVGDRTLQFTSAGLTAATSNVVTITAGAPTQMAINGGDGQTATAGSPVTTAPSVIVRDASNNPVPGVNVTFAVTAGGGSVLPVSAVATNAAGVASATSWTLGTAAGANSLTATAAPGGITPNPVTFTATAEAGSAGKLAMFTQPPTNATSGLALSPAPVVQLQDVNGNPVASAGIAITATIASGPGGSLTGDIASTDANGRATFSSLVITGPAGSYTLQFGGTNLTGVTSNAVTLAAGAATKLVVLTQPTTAQSGIAFSPVVTVQAQDAAGNPVAVPTRSVQVSILSGGGTLSGTTTRTTDGSAVATFTGLTLSGTIGPRTLLFASSGLTSATSDPIDLTPGTPAALAWVQQPTAVVAGAAIAPSPSVRILDGADNIVTTATNPVTIAISNNPGGSTLGGTTTVAPVLGVATFTTLSLNKAGAGYTLAASSAGLTGATSSGFTVSAAAPAALVFVSQPSNTAAGATVSPAVTVRIVDAFGNPTTSTASVGLALDANPTAAVLSGGSPVAAVSGLATFAGLSVSKAGSGFTLAASSGGLTQDISNSFDITSAPTTTSITSDSPDPSVVGQSVTVNYSVTSGAGTPTGTVTISSDDGTFCSASVAAGTCSGSFATIGVKTLTANYGGDGTFSPSGSAGATHTVNQAATTTALTGHTPDPSALGAAVSVTWTVGVTAPGAGTPTGTVTVSDGVDNCQAAVGVGGCSINLTTVGTRPLTATYDGDLNFAGSASSPTDHIVSAAATTTVLGSSLNPSTFGALVTFTATVTGPGGTPTGTVQFKDGAADLGAPAALNGSGVATFATSALSVASHSVTAVYSGDATYATSTSAVVDQVVDPAPTTTTITTDLSAATVVNQGYTVNFTVTSGGGTPSGSVTVSDGDGQSCGPVALTGGAGSCVLTSLSAGTKTVVATYAATTNFAASNSMGTSHPVDAFGTATALEFQVQPSATLAGATIAPPVEVRVVDAFGNIVSSAATPIGLTIGSNPSSGNLTGGAAVAPVNGVATFGALSIDLAGVGYTLNADDGVLTTAVSSAFTIN